MAGHNTRKAKPSSKKRPTQDRDSKHVSAPGPGSDRNPQLIDETSNAPERKEEQRVNKIFPRNLTARAAYLVPGNPVVTRPEDAVANCFPGLEVDIRNLDRRFFPGLVFEFVADGAKLAYVDALEDPDLQLQEAKVLYGLLADDNVRNALEHGNLLPGKKKQLVDNGVWYLDWVKQGSRPISMPRDGSQVWRLIRSLEPDSLTIGLRLRPSRGGSRKDGEDTLKLVGWRRRYTDKETGVINGAYQPGELGQGLCSPWQHDFRDCQCFYWAANHPDVVLGELYPGESLPPDGNPPVAGQGGGVASQPPQGQPILSSIPIDWIRADRSRALAAGARPTIAENRPYQLDHFQINNVWQELSIVLEGREIGGVYNPQTIETANPYDSEAALGEKLRNELAPLELALVFEYLYAYFSLITDLDAKKEGGESLRNAVALARQHLMLTAASEMQHLRWVNQILWELKLTPKFEPVLIPANEIPTNKAAVDLHESARTAMRARIERAESAGETTQRALKAFTHIERRGGSGSSGTRPAGENALKPEILEDFIAVEHPSGYIDGRYAKVIATLRKFNHPEMAELALRIAGDGVQHEIRFCEIKSALSPYFPTDPAAPPIYLRAVTPERDKAEAAVEPLQTIKENIRAAYTLAGNGAIEKSGVYVSKARDAMTKLLDVGEKLASDGVGIPFFQIWNSL
jgi:hypothetical protein